MLVFIWPQNIWGGKLHVDTNDHTTPYTGQLFSYFQQKELSLLVFICI